MVKLKHSLRGDESLYQRIKEIRNALHMNQMEFFQKTWPEPVFFGDDRGWKTEIQ